jgi:hypothetical protein
MLWIYLAFIATGSTRVRALYISQQSYQRYRELLEPSKKSLAKVNSTKPDNSYWFIVESYRRLSYV